MNPNKKKEINTREENKDIDIIEDDIIDVDEVIEDEFDNFYDQEKDYANFDGFRKMLEHQKQKGYFYPDDDDDEIIVDEDPYDEEDENEEYDDKLRKTYQSYYDIIESNGGKKDEEK